MIQQLFSPLLAVIYILLIGLGCVYNVIIARWERRNYLEGYTALAVVLGVTVTLLPFWFFPSVPIWKVYLAFVCTGTPMIAGSIVRHVKARSSEQESLRHE